MSEPNNPRDPSQQNPIWKVSTDDGVLHGWVMTDPTSGNWIAWCGRSVPATDITDDRGEPKDMACLLAEGDRLATAFERMVQQLRQDPQLDDLTPDTPSGNEESDQQPGHETEVDNEDQ